MLTKLTRFSYRRRGLVLLAWIVAAAALILVGFRFAAEADNDFTGASSDSGRAQRLIAQHFPERDGDSMTLAIHAEHGVREPAARARVERVLADARRIPHVAAVSSPYATAGQVSPDGRTAFAAIQLSVTSDKMPLAPVKKMISQVRAASGDGVRMAVGGGPVAAAETPNGGSTEGIGILAAIVVLLIAFGSLLAMGLPIVTALFGIGTGLAGIELLGHLLPGPSFMPIVAALIGLGVGVDYALFIVTRYREALEEGAEPEAATVTAISTAGRSVLFAGTTVVIALMGLFVMQQRLLNAVAVAASLTVLATMAAAVTLLPALLGFVGRRIDRLRLPLFGRTRTASPLAERWAGVVQRRPVTALVAAGVALLVLAAPALSMRLSFADASTMPRDTSSYQSHRILADGFGAGYDAPLVVVAESSGDVAPVRAAIADTPGVASVTPSWRSRDGAATMFIAYPTTGVQDAATPRLVHRLRATVIPRSANGTLVRVGGPNAGVIDFADQVQTRLPWLVAIVVTLALLVLLLLVRSVTIAVKAALMTVLSVAVAYGVLTAIVQWGWLGHGLGFPTTMPISAWVPLMTFPILFGLSTDYEVFLISRIREEYDHGAETRQAVTRGLARTGRVITAAAAIMIAVFCSVLLNGSTDVKQFGLGLAIAVLIDATLVRMVLVPALMELLGRLNWWLPAWLDRRMPRLRVDGATPNHLDPQTTLIATAHRKD